MAAAGLAGCQTATTADEKAAANAPAVRLLTLDPGHFHAALVQKNNYPGVDSVVHVYAPKGPDVQQHLDRIAGYNACLLYTSPSPRD